MTTGTAETSALVGITDWHPVDLGPVLRGEQVASPPSVLRRSDGVCLLYAGRTNLLMGETESCKSWLAMEGVRQELAAENHVVLLDYEDGPESAVERLRALGATVEAIAKHLTYINPSGRFDEFARDALESAIERRGNPTLAVIDGCTEAMGDLGLDPNKGPDVAAYYAGSPRWFARQGAATVIVDHVTKSREGRGRWAIGSERKLSGLTGAAYGFEAATPFGRGRTGTVRITVAKDRSGHIRQHETVGGLIAVAELKSWPDEGVTVSLSPPDTTRDGPFRPTHLMARISRYIDENPGLTTNAIRAGVKGKNDAKQLALELLVNEEYVEVQRGPNRSHCHFSKRPFCSTERGVSDEDS